MSLKKQFKKIKFQNRRKISIKYSIDDEFMWVKSHLKDDHHDMQLYWKISLETHAVTEIDGSMDNYPFNVCQNALNIVRRIKGLEISVGVKKAFRQLFKKPEGCTHITELAMATFDFIMARLHGPSTVKFSQKEKEKRMSQIAQFLCKNDSCVVFNKENLDCFDERGKFKGKDYHY